MASLYVEIFQLLVQMAIFFAICHYGVQLKPKKRSPSRRAAQSKTPQVTTQAPRKRYKARAPTDTELYEKERGL